MQGGDLELGLPNPSPLAAAENTFKVFSAALDRAVLADDRAKIEWLEPRVKDGACLAE